MKGTEQFKEIIKNYLDNRAKEDELFRVKYESTARSIDDIVTYILNEVQQCGFSDMEVFSMAVHAAEEPTLIIGEPLSCDVVVNRHIELTEEEKAEQRDLALKRYQEEELRKIQVRNSRPKPGKPKVPQQAELSLFDF